MSWKDDPRIGFIVKYVRSERERLGVQPRPGKKPELSGEMFGEFRLLLERQLILTPEFEDGWRELRENDDKACDAIVEGVITEIRRRSQSEREVGTKRSDQSRSGNGVNR